MKKIKISPTERSYILAERFLSPGFSACFLGAAQTGNKFAVELSAEQINEVRELTIDHLQAVGFGPDDEPTAFIGKIQKQPHKIGCYIADNTQCYVDEIAKYRVNWADMAR